MLHVYVCYAYVMSACVLLMLCKYAILMVCIHAFYAIGMFPCVIVMFCFQGCLLMICIQVY